MKNFNGKAIYNPSGKAGEYSYWACNFYVGCSNGCTYCYCKKGILAGAMGQDKPQLKKCFKDEQHALQVFVNEMEKNKNELQKHGLFFSFTTDPMLEETYELTIDAANHCFMNEIPVYILTKTTWWINNFFPPKKYAVIGFTLTGHDELEPNAASNDERIEAMKILHRSGITTFASIEPVINIDKAWKTMNKTFGYCNQYKIGLESGGKYDKHELIQFMRGIHGAFHEYPIYWKDSIINYLGIKRESLPSNCVNRNYRLHEASFHVA